MKTIQIVVRNSFIDEVLAIYKMPFDPRKAVLGFYHKFWKDAKSTHADTEKIDKTFIKGKIKIFPNKTDRLIIKLPSGAELNCPFDLEPIDVDIIQLHLQALSLAKFGYPKEAKHEKRKSKKSN